MVRTPLDWVWCEGQFNVMADSQHVPAITKFSHLKELVVPRIRTTSFPGPFLREGKGPCYIISRYIPQIIPRKSNQFHTVDHKSIVIIRSRLIYTATDKHAALFHLNC